MLGVLKNFGCSVLDLNVYCYAFVTKDYEIELIVLCELNRKKQDIKIKTRKVSIRKLMSLSKIKNGN